MDNSEKEKIEKYFKECDRHDWLYAFSDSYTVYLNGHSSEQRLLVEARVDKDKQRIYDAFHSYINSVIDKDPIKKPEINDFMS